jgi:hypothetical protein
MEEIFTGILKGATYLFRACIENGIWEISIRKPGKLLLKSIWPPFWFKPIDYNGSIITVLGFVFWCVMAYAYYYLFKNY